jgi:hypothetical protein
MPVSVVTGQNNERFIELAYIYPGETKLVDPEIISDDGFANVFVVHCKDDDLESEVFMIKESPDYDANDYKDELYLMKKCADSGKGVMLDRVPGFKIEFELPENKLFLVSFIHRVFMAPN